MTYQHAKAYCESDNAVLATPRSEEENKFIAGLLPSNNIWIGVDDLVKNKIWISAASGEEITYSNWRQGEPTYTWRGKDENCVQILSKQGTWNDIRCEYELKFACIYDIASKIIYNSIKSFQ